MITLRNQTQDISEIHYFLNFLKTEQFSLNFNL